MAKTVGTCEACGAQFESWPSQRRRFCSRSCKGTVQATEQWALRERKPMRPRRGRDVPCATCGTMVYRQPRLAERERTYCSYACKHAEQRAGQQVKQCVQCGAEFSVSPSKAAIRFCSKRCDGQSRIVRAGNREHNGRLVRQDRNGYVLVWQPEHPNKTLKGWQYEHRLVAERKLGRLLASDEHVHHVNNVKDDNRPENLEAMGHLDHAALSSQEWHAQVRSDQAELAEYRRRYGPLEPEV